VIAGDCKEYSVIPAKAGIHFDLVFGVPFGDNDSKMDPGLTSLRLL